MAVDCAALTALLQAEPDVEAAWLVGSQARGEARPDSDVDVAVLFAEEPAGADPLDIAIRRGRLMDDLAAALKVHVDVLDVERISPVAFGIAMKCRVPLLDRNHARMVEVLSDQYARWHDMQPHYELQRQAVRDSFARAKG